MKANELRIGNKLINEGYIIDVASIHKEHIEFWGNGVYGECFINEAEPIPLNEEWLVKFGFENWGLGTQYINEYESYIRYVLHNVLDGTSNFEVHYIKSTYGNTEDYQYVISCDEDDRVNWGKDIECVHQLQNLYFALVGEELTINE